MLKEIYNIENNCIRYKKYNKIEGSNVQCTTLIPECPNSQIYCFVVY